MGVAAGAVVLTCGSARWPGLGCTPTTIYRDGVMDRTPDRWT